MYLYLLIVDDTFTLKGMITLKDIDKAQTYPLASKDEHARLLVGASVGTSADTDDRVQALVEAGVDVVVVDTAHGHSRNVLNRVAWIKQHFPDLQVIGGNVATTDGALALRVARCRSRGAPHVCRETQQQPEAVGLA